MDPFSEGDRTPSYQDVTMKHMPTKKNWPSLRINQDQAEASGGTKQQNAETFTQHADKDKNLMEAEHTDSVNMQ